MRFTFASDVRSALDWTPVAALALALGASLNAYAGDETESGPAPAPGSVSIAGFTHTGNACPEGSVAANLSPDAQALTLLFDRWMVDAEESASPVAQKQCKLDLRLTAPAGWRYAILGLDYRGYADLEAGARAEQTASYRFNGGAAGRLQPVTLAGPVSTDYLSSAAIELASLPWSSCGGDMTLTIESSTKIDVSLPPEEVVMGLASSHMKYSATDLGRTVLGMTLLKKESGAPCQQGKSFGFNGTSAWVHKGCRGQFKLLVAAPAPAVRPRGMITVDSIDGQLTQNYGIAWQQCLPGRWVQGDGHGHCKAVCKAAGMQPGRDPGGAACASGEARPASAIGQIAFKHGCWNGCTAMGNLPTQETPGGFCYAPGQKRDADRTDRTIGCFCY